MNSEKALAKILRDRIQKFIDRGGDLRTLIKQIRQTADLIEAECLAADLSQGKF